MHIRTLCTAFGLGEPALARISAIVHDLDLKDGKFGAPECSTVDAMIEGLQLSYQNDDALLEQGMTVFHSLYRSFEQSSRAAGPRRTARSKRRGQATGGSGDARMGGGSGVVD